MTLYIVFYACKGGRPDPLRIKARVASQSSRLWAGPPNSPRARMRHARHWPGYRTRRPRPPSGPFFFDDTLTPVAAATSPRATAAIALRRFASHTRSFAVANAARRFAASLSAWTLRMKASMTRSDIGIALGAQPEREWGGLAFGPRWV